MVFKTILNIWGSARRRPVRRIWSSVRRIRYGLSQVQPNLSWVSGVLLKWPDAEKITSDGMMNKQTQTFNFCCFYFSYYIILCFLEIFKELGMVFFCGILGFGAPPPPRIPQALSLNNFHQSIFALFLLILFRSRKKPEYTCWRFNILRKQQANNNCRKPIQFNSLFPTI